MSERIVMQGSEQIVRKKRESMLLITLRRLAKNKLTMAGLIILLLMMVLSFLAPVLAPYPFEQTDLYSETGTAGSCPLDARNRQIKNQLQTFRQASGAFPWRGRFCCILWRKFS